MRFGFEHIGTYCDSKRGLELVTGLTARPIQKSLDYTLGLLKVLHSPFALSLVAVSNGWHPLTVGLSTSPGLGCTSSRLADSLNSAHKSTSPLHCLAAWLSPIWHRLPALQTNTTHGYVTTDGQSASLSLCQSPSWVQYQIFVTVRRSRVCRSGDSFWQEVESVVYNCCSNLSLHPSSFEILSLSTSATHP